MDTDNDPLYGRRVRGTPANKFASSVAAGIIIASGICGIGCQ